MPEITVSMPAYDSGKYIREAIESVLRQDGVDFELVVVDDASRDDTAAVVQTFTDPRIRLIRNPSHRGVAFCHNVVIANSTSPFIAHVDSDDMILPGALRVMVAALRSFPQIGQAYCHFFPIPERGDIAPKAFQAWRAALLRYKPPDVDHRRALLVHGMVASPLRTYRREVFDVVGRFDETLTYAVDYEMAVRIADNYELRLVPEFMYARRIHGANLTATLRFKAMRFWWKRLVICHKLFRSGRVAFLKRSPWRNHALLVWGFVHVLQIPRIVKDAVRWPSRAWRAVWSRGGH